MSVFPSKSDNYYFKNRDDLFLITEDSNTTEHKHQHKYSPTDTYVCIHVDMHIHITYTSLFWSETHMKLRLTSVLIKISSVNLILDFQY